VKVRLSAKESGGHFETHFQVVLSAKVKGLFKHSGKHLHVVSSAKVLLVQTETQTLSASSAHVSAGQNATHVLLTRLAK
jgi:hypothetical protein